MNNDTNALYPRSPVSRARTMNRITFDLSIILITSARQGPSVYLGLPSSPCAPVSFLLLFFKSPRKKTKYSLCECSTRQRMCQLNHMPVSPCVLGACETKVLWGTLNESTLRWRVNHAMGYDHARTNDARARVIHLSKARDTRISSTCIQACEWVTYSM